MLKGNLKLKKLWLKMVTGQLTDKPTRGHSSRGLLSSRTSQFVEMFD